MDATSGRGESPGRFASDRHSGSSEVGLAFLDSLERWAAMDVSSTPQAFEASLLAELRRAQAAQPSMALLHQLAARALDVALTGIARSDRPATLRAAIAESCAAERTDRIAAVNLVAERAIELLGQRDAWIATLSRSGAVLAGLERAHSLGRRPRALVGEGRPLLEGRAMARDLASIGIPVWLVVDASLPLLLSQATMVWLGADAVTERGIINKIGSFAVALAAREHGVPVYALADRRKFIPAATPSLKIAEMPSHEVWAEPPDGVQPRNVYFELVPLTLLRGIVTEDAVLGPSEAAVVARERPLPDPLAAEPSLNDS